MLQQIKETADFLKEKTNAKPEVGIILGTGLGGLVEEIEIEHSISYKNKCYLLALCKLLSYLMIIWRKLPKIDLTHNPTISLEKLDLKEINILFYYFAYMFIVIFLSLF